jgi:DNA-binding response OmpR family regulator
VASTKGVHRVLVADDDAQIAALLREALAADGHAVVLAKDGGEALKALASARYALLIVDYQMPVKSGLEVIRELRARGEQTPALLISSHLPDEVRRAFTEDDRVASLDKPFSLADLRNTVDLLVRVRS